jgi:hypothetical protein
MAIYRIYICIKDSMGGKGNKIKARLKTLTQVQLKNLIWIFKNKLLVKETHVPGSNSPVS